MNSFITLHCPQHGSPLHLLPDRAAYRCDSGCQFAVKDQVPRFVPLENYASSFGLQWNTFRTTQLDSHTGLPISKERLTRIAGGSLEIFKGKNVLEAGCGAGRFTEVMLEAGANVFAIDLSVAVEANFKNFLDRPGYIVCQADILAAPVAAEQFDIVVCIGVIQSTPDSKETIIKLCSYLKPRGTLLIDHYSHEYPMTAARIKVRDFLRGKNKYFSLRFIQFMVGALWPLHALSFHFRNAKGVRRFRRRFLSWSPVVDYHDAYPSLGNKLLHQWAILDTHDTLTDHYKHLLGAEEIRSILQSCRMTNIQIDHAGNGVEARASKESPGGRSCQPSFEKDPFPGKAKILFIALGQSSHTQAWIDLLSGSEFNVRLFAAAKGSPPPDWPVKSYIHAPQAGKEDEFRSYLSSGVKGKLGSFANKIARRVGAGPVSSPAIWLAAIIKKWRPDIIHVIGLFDDQGGLFYLHVREKFKLENYGRLIIQLSGGSDMELRRHDPGQRAIIQRALQECACILSDNRANIDYAAALGIPADRFAAIVPVPGAGGIELDDPASATTAPSRRERLILWPKAYECQWSKALPVLEAFRIAWKKTAPFEINLLAVTPDVREWVLSLPEEIRRHCHISPRLPQTEFFTLLKRARVMLAPSLVDGLPNCLIEAMAFGAMPIVSPLATITPVVRQDEHVLFARNLYPDEIAAALVRALEDDALVDRAAQNNLRLVETIANRRTIRKQVIDFYSALLGSPPAR